MSVASRTRKAARTAEPRGRTAAKSQPQRTRPELAHDYAPAGKRDVNAESDRLRKRETYLGLVVNGRRRARIWTQSSSM